MKRTWLILSCIALIGCLQFGLAQDAKPVAALPNTPAIGFDAPIAFDQLPLLVDWPAYQDSSFSRKHVNADSGMYIRTEANGEKVMMDADGPGVVYRMWSTGATGSVHPNPNTKWMFYFDGAKQPSMTLTATELFGDRGAKWPFLPPLAKTFQSGFGGGEGPASICYVPIPFAKHLKITTDSAEFYHVDYHKLPVGSVKESFSYDLAAKNRPALEKMAQMLKARGQMPAAPAEPMLAQEGPVTVEPGKTAVLFEGTGPAIVRALRVKLDLPSDANLRGLVLQIQYEGSAIMSVNCPIGDFFGCSGSDLRYRSLPMGATESGYYCYFPMPYRKSIRIAVRNDTTEAANLSRDVQVQKVASLPASAGYFHAAFHHEVNTKVGTGNDYNILDVQAGAGKFVGCTILMQSAHGQGGVNFLEGDENIFVDDEKTWPSRWSGTGTEDYFNGAYYWNAIRDEDKDGPYGGLQLRDDGLRRVCAYRWHTNEFISFKKRIVVGIEHGGDDEWPNDYSSVGYYYLDKPAGVTPLAPLAQRMVRSEIMGGPLMMGCRFEGQFTTEGKPLATRGQAGEPQLETGKIQIGVGPPYVQRFCSAKEIGQEIAGGLFVPGPDAYRMTAYLAVGPSYGHFGIYINDQLVSYVNTYAPNFHPGRPFDLGLVNLKEGVNKLVFRAEGQDEHATAMDLGIVAWHCNPQTAKAVNKWAVIGTWPCPKEGGWEKANPPETEQKLDASYEVTFGTGAQAQKRTVKWQAKDAGFWSGSVFGDSPWVCCYALTYVWSPKDQTLGAFIAKDDALKVWVNGKEVFDNNSWSHFLDCQFIAACPLKAGWNTLLVKNGNWDGMWGFSLKISDPQGELKFANEKPADMK